MKIDNILSMIRTQAQKQIDKIALVWKIETRKITPRGYTYLLKRTLITMKPKKGVGILMKSPRPYSYIQAIKSLRHVPIRVMGILGFQHFDRGKGKRTVKAKYYRGYNWAVKQGIPKYRHDYPQEGWRLVRGDTLMEKLQKIK